MVVLPRRVSGAETATARVPAPAFLVGVRDPYRVVVPYSKYQLVAIPFGLSVPFSLADVSEIALAAPVTTSGGPPVEKRWSAPRLVPPSLVATSRKW